MINYQYSVKPVPGTLGTSVNYRTLSLQNFSYKYLYNNKRQKMWGHQVGAVSEEAVQSASLSPNPPTLSTIRRSLIQQEDTIIFALISRAEHAHNPAIYTSSDRIPVPAFHVGGSGSRASLLEFVLRSTEQQHGGLGRYLHPEEHAFYTESLPMLVIPPRSYEDSLPPYAKSININTRIMSMYVDSLLPNMGLKDKDGNYGSAVMCDVACLQALSKRIHYGKYVAEAKFNESPDTYTSLITQQDRDGIMRLLTFADVEKRVIERVRAKAAVFGQDLGEAGSDAGLEMGSVRRKIQPEVVAKLYEEWVMPLTKEVQVEYLLRRLG